MTALNITVSELMAYISGEGYEMKEGHTLELRDDFVTDGSRSVYIYKGSVRIAAVTGGSLDVMFLRLKASGLITGKDKQSMKDAAAALEANLKFDSDTDEAVCVQFFGLLGQWFWMDTDTLAGYEGDMHQLLVDHGVTEENAAEVLNRDWAYADYQGAVTNVCASEWSFDWEQYNQITESDMDTEALLAGLSLGFSVEECEDKYYGHFETEGDLAEDYVDNTGMLHGVSDSIKSYFDYESFGRDLAMDFSSHDGHYFTA